MDLDDKDICCKNPTIELGYATILRNYNIQRYGIREKNHSTSSKEMGVPVGSIAIFSCNESDATIRGADVRTCLPTGQWSDKLPTCSSELLH